MFKSGIRRSVSKEWQAIIISLIMRIVDIDHYSEVLPTQS